MRALPRTLHAPNLPVAIRGGKLPAFSACSVEIRLEGANLVTGEAHVLPALNTGRPCWRNDEWRCLRSDAASNEREAQTQSDVKVSHALWLSRVIRRVHGRPSP
jgi:hypothetical protein